MRTSFAILSCPGVALTYLFFASSQNCSMIDLSCSRWIPGAHWFFITTKPPRLSRRSRMWESQPYSRWGAGRDVFSMSGATNPDCNWSCERTVLMSVATLPSHSSCRRKCLVDLESWRYSKLGYPIPPRHWSITSAEPSCSKELFAHAGTPSSPSAPVRAVK